VGVRRRGFSKNVSDKDEGEHYIKEDLRLKRNGGMGAQLRAKAMGMQRAQERESKCKSEQVSQQGKTTRGMASAQSTITPSV
jgi:hypothetical protein